MNAEIRRMLRKKLLASRARLMRTRPFFALMLMYVRFVAVAETEQLSTNGIGIFFSAEYLISLAPAELDYLLCHQSMHILRGDIWRPLALSGDAYHRRCDAEIEAELEHCGLTKQCCGHFRCLTGELRGMRMIDTDRFWSIGEAPDEDAVVVLEGSCDDVYSNGERLRALWEIRLSAAAKTCDARQDKVGNLPLMVKRRLGQAHPSCLNRRKALREIIEEQTYDYSFSPPDRRYSDGDFYLPDFHEEDFVPRDVLFWVDTSGSMDEDTLATIYAELAAALAQFRGKLIGKLGFFDTEASDPKPFSSVGELLGIVPVGGGGTDLSAPFAYVGREYRRTLPSCMVILTDGDADFPPKKDAMGIPTLWIFTDREAKAPWGKAVFLP